MSNLALNPVASAARTPDQAAAITDESAMTYADLNAASARLARTSAGSAVRRALNADRLPE